MSAAGVEARLRADAERLGFAASSDDATRQLLALLVASRTAPRVLELGTGVGLGTAAMLAALDPGGRVVSVEFDEALLDSARREITDDRVTFVHADAGGWLERSAAAGERFDVVFADTWAGKFTHLDEALGLVVERGWYVVDDLLPQPNWPDGHQRSVDALRARLDDLAGWRTLWLDWSTGVLACVRTAEQQAVVTARRS